MLRSIGRLKPTLLQCRAEVYQPRCLSTDGGPKKRRSSKALPFLGDLKPDEKTEWWVVDGEMHEVGNSVPPRERFVIPRDNIPNRRRKQLREQFMNRTRLVLKESEYDPWCKRYMDLYQELRENWERLYWDEGYSKKIAQEHANYESADDDDQDFNPYRSRRHDYSGKDHGFERNHQGNSFEQASLVRDKFENDRARRIREKAFAPMRGPPSMDASDSHFRRQPFDATRYFTD